MGTGGWIIFTSANHSHLFPSAGGTRCETLSTINGVWLIDSDPVRLIPMMMARIIISLKKVAASSRRPRLELGIPTGFPADLQDTYSPHSPYSPYSSDPPYSSHSPSSFGPPYSSHSPCSSNPPYSLNSPSSSDPRYSSHSRYSSYFSSSLNSPRIPRSPHSAHFRHSAHSPRVMDSIRLSIFRSEWFDDSAAPSIVDQAR